MLYNEVIEDIFFGNLRPNEMPVRQDSHYAKALGRFCENEEWLTEHLEGESKTHLIRLMNDHDSIVGETAYENFRYGFRLGMMLMLEVCTDDIKSAS